MLRGEVFTTYTDAVLPVMEPNIPSRSTPTPYKENMTH